MKQTIFTVYVLMQDQTQCDRMKQFCVDNNLSIWDDKSGFYFIDGCVFAYNKNPIVKEFYCLKSDIIIKNFTQDYSQVTEEQFIKLLKEYKNETKK